MKKQRQFRKLRISLTSACNFICPYCVNGMGGPKAEYAPEPEVVTEWVKALQKEISLSQVRLTGGEPLMYAGVEQLIRLLRESDITNIAMTTNASLLHNRARELKESGLISLNISLDAIDETIFKKMGGVKRENVFKAIDESLDAGLHVKLNVTLYKGINENQILPLLRFAQNKKIVIRFLETMTMGHLHQGPNRYHVPAQNILSEIQKEFEITPLGRQAGDTAHYYRLNDGTQFGIIGNHTLPFCSDCDRLRLDLRGNLYGCLSSEKSVPIHSPGLSLKSNLAMAMSHKQTEKFSGSMLSMRYIGG